MRYARVRARGRAHRCPGRRSRQQGSSRSRTSSRACSTACRRSASGNFFSFFTIQTNLFAIVMLVLVTIVRPAERTILFDTVRGAVTLYIAITGAVFALLLVGTPGEPRHAYRLGQLRRPQADPGRPGRRLAGRSAPASAGIPRRRGVAALPVGLPRLHAGAGAARPLVSVPVPGCVPARLRPRPGRLPRMAVRGGVAAAAFVAIGNRRVRTAH